jgi:hypothetical protein
VCKSNPLYMLLRVGLLAAFALLNRLIDILHMGDSLIVELRRGSTR